MVCLWWPLGDAAPPPPWRDVSILCLCCLNNAKFVGKIVVTRYEILRRKFTKFDFGLASAEPTQGSFSAPQIPLLDLRSLLLRGEKGILNTPLCQHAMQHLGGDEFPPKKHGRLEHWKHFAGLYWWNSQHAANVSDFLQHR